jgi:hypothetical protein
MSLPLPLAVSTMRAEPPSSSTALASGREPRSFERRSHVEIIQLAAQGPRSAHHPVQVKARGLV